MPKAKPQSRKLPLLVLNTKTGWLARRAPKR